MPKSSIKTAEIALVAATAKTVLQITAAANRKVKVASWGISFDGIVVTEEPVLVELIRSTTAGTGSASPPTGTKLDDDEAGSIGYTAAHNFTAEPTMGDIVDAITVHPQGIYQIWFPESWEVYTSLEAGTADWLNIRCTAPSAVDVIAKMFCED